MPIPRQSVSVVAFAVASAPACPALAFGGTASELGQQGNFVVSNRANLGFSQSLTSPSTTQFTLAPELDYFVIPHLSVGGAVVFDFNAPPRGPSTTAFGVVPQVGYDVVLSGTWSFWPRAALGLMTGTPAQVTIELSAPFLVHPAQHFFFGFGPALATDLNASNPPVTLFGTFLVGGYFDS